MTEREDYPLREERLLTRFINNVLNPRAIQGVTLKV